VADRLVGEVPVTGTSVDYYSELKFNKELKKFLSSRLKKYYTSRILEKRIPQSTDYATTKFVDIFTENDLGDTVVEFCRVPVSPGLTDEVFSEPVLRQISKDTDQLFLDLGIRNIIIGQDLDFFSDGFIAGGAIAALINEYYFGVPAVINDIDYFYYDRKTSCTNDAEYIPEIDDDFIKKHKYQIIGSEVIYKNNNIRIRTRYDFKWELLLKSFDLNCTMVGFHPISNEIIFNDNFIDFLTNREIKIVDGIKLEDDTVRSLNKATEIPSDGLKMSLFVNFNSFNQRDNLKFSNIIRANKKKAELKAIYKFDYDIKKIIYSSGNRVNLLINKEKIRVYTSFNKFNKSKNDMACFIPKKEIKILFNNNKLLSPYFKLKRKNASLYLEFQDPKSKNNEIIRSLDCRKGYYFQRFKNKYNLTTNKNFPFDELSKFEFCQFNRLISFWDNTFSNMGRSDLFPMFDSFIFIFSSIISNRIELSINNMNDIKQIVECHPTLLGYFVTSNHLLNISDLLWIYRKIIKEDNVAIVGVLENKIYEGNPIFSQNRETIYKYLVNEFIKIQKDDFLIKPLLIGIYSKYCSELYLNSQLVKEGLDLRHCVGGYGSRVREGLSRIFDIKLNDQRSTVEFDVNQINKFLIKYTIRQHKSSFNREPSKQHKSLAKLLCNKLNSI
jgi:hypothetical protein